VNTHVKRAIIAAARATPSEEICGLIYHTATEVLTYPCVNVTAEARTEAFEIDPQAYIAARGLGRVCGVYHSHPEGAAAFSEADLEVAEELALPYHLYATTTDEWATYVPRSYHVDPVGLPFIWGQWDCLEAVRLHYRQECGVYLTDYPRDETFRAAHPRAILDHIEDEGFVNLGADPSAAQAGDVLLFNSGGQQYPHHLAVYMGRMRMLHHPYGVLSRIDDLDERGLRRVAGVLRYTGDRPAKPSLVNASLSTVST
jgi:proteasome lid subunit RPN8/RPN11